jgi:hypothetical protein
LIWIFKVLECTSTTSASFLFFLAGALEHGFAMAGATLG